MDFFETMLQQKLAKSGGGGGSALVVETVYVPDSSYFKSTIQADSVSNAFKNGQNVVFHIPPEQGLISDDFYVSLICYSDETPTEYFELASYGNTQLHKEAEVTEDGYLSVGMYSD